jgi:hypothetical protein
LETVGATLKSFVVRAPAYVVVVAAALTIWCCSAALAATRTTAPGKHVLVYFVINDKRVAYEILRTTAGGGTDQLTLTQYVVRGDLATFYIINRAHKRHGFTFFGRKIPPLKPGARVHFTASLIRRGRYPYASTPNQGKAFRGVFPVF